jgi:hypothetical protein
MAHRAYKIIDRAKAALIEWARERAIPLHTVEYVAAFEPWSDRLSVWVFYETDAQTKEYETNGVSKQIEARHLGLLQQLRFPFKQFPKVDFTFDSHENVERNFEGSYFYRLR